MQVTPILSTNDIDVRQLHVLIENWNKGVALLQLYRAIKWAMKFCRVAIINYY